MFKYTYGVEIARGSYGVVFLARDTITNDFVAIKKCPLTNEKLDPTSEREIQALKQLRHENITELLEVFVSKRSLYLVFTNEEMTLSTFLHRHGERAMETHAVRTLARQLVRAVTFCHENGIMHRDIKPPNILVNTKLHLKLCDFGLCRFKAEEGEYTPHIVTRWYRSPELLLGSTTYDEAVDVWATGCVLAEMATRHPLLPGESDIDQLRLVMERVGTAAVQTLAQNLKVDLQLTDTNAIPVSPQPWRRIMAGVDPHLIDLVGLTLACDPSARPKMNETLVHPFFSFDQDLQFGFSDDEKENHNSIPSRGLCASPSPGGCGSGPVSLTPLPSPSTLDRLFQDQDDGSRACASASANDAGSGRGRGSASREEGGEGDAQDGGSGG